MERRFFWRESLDSRYEVRDLKNLIIESSSSSSSSSSSYSSSCCWRRGRKMRSEEVGGVEKREKRFGVLGVDLDLKSESER